MRKNHKIDYVIMALVCLVFLNIGTIGIRVYSNFRGPVNINKEKPNIIRNIINYGEMAWNL